MGSSLLCIALALAKGLSTAMMLASSESLQDEELLLLALQVNEQGRSARAFGHAVYDRAKALENTDTPYGCLVKTLEAPKEPDPEAEPEPGAEPEVVLLKYVCPFALLWLTSQECPGFLQFMLKFACMSMAAFRASQYWDEAKPGAQPPARIAIYEDEVTPGNNRRHDKGRKYLAIYWTFLDLPEWFRSSMNGWFTFSFITATKMENIRGRDSQLTRLVLKAFFAGGLSPDFATTGIVLSEKLATDGAEPRAFWFRGVFCCFTTDADGHRKITQCRGTSGTKVCASCINVVDAKAGAIPPGSDLVHHTCGDLSKMKRLSPQELSQLMAYLRAQSCILGPTAFGKLQQEVGWNFSEYSLVCSDMATIANIPDSVYWDWMHTLCSSGGVAQYEMNQYLVRVKHVDNRLLGTLEEFKKQVVLPKALAKPMKRIVFADRINTKPHTHIKAFASEVLSMMVVLGLWVELTLLPEGVLPEETKCLLLLGRILFLLRTGDRVLSKLPLLQQLILQHHDLFVRLYPEEAKPKVHLLLHVPTLIARFGINLSCFVTERKHKQSKGMGAFCFNNMVETMLRNTLRNSFKHFQEPGSFDPVQLIPFEGLHPRYAKGVRRQWEGRLVLAGLVQAQPAGAQPNFLVASKARAPCGQPSKGDLAVWNSQGSCRAGFIQLIFKVLAGAQPGMIYACVLMLKPLGLCRCSKAARDVSLAYVPVMNILGVFPHLVEDDVVYIAASADVM